MMPKIGQQLNAIAWIQLLLDREIMRYAPKIAPYELN